jgi:4-amino-4-deoxy-L-arabinose transferase-like glycosyltransferase
VKLPTRKHAALWYWNAHTRYGPPETLMIARLPFLAAGMLGCVAVYACGFQIGGRAAAVIAAAMLAINPLYRLHAHRAMSDVPCEAFTIAALAGALWGARRIWSGRKGALPFATAGLCSGLAIVCKLNGLLAPMIITAWCGAAALAPGLDRRARSKLAGVWALSMGLMTMAVVALNPTLTCRPPGSLHPDIPQVSAHDPLSRFREILRYRIDSAAGQQEMEKFARDIVKSPRDKFGVFAVQGFGRFGPLGPSKSNSEIRYDAAQDWGLVIWWPVIFFGLFRSFRLGVRQFRAGTFPAGLGLLIWALVSWSVVAGYLPMAWDRYFMPIQAPNALMAAVALSPPANRWRRKAVPA